MTKLILTAKLELAEIIEQNLQDKSLSELCEIEENEEVTKLGTREYIKPIRIGKIIDDIFKAQKNQTSKKKIITFNNATLNTHSLEFIRLDGSCVSLTEKETEILEYLSKNKEKNISKTELLKYIWGYADTVETHTLETHIYRLRQKIERDPTQPEILLTKENGYGVI